MLSTSTASSLPRSLPFFPSQNISFTNLLLFPFAPSCLSAISYNQFVFPLPPPTLFFTLLPLFTSRPDFLVYPFLFCHKTPQSLSSLSYFNSFFPSGKFYSSYLFYNFPHMPFFLLFFLICYSLNLLPSIFAELFKFYLSSILILSYLNLLPCPLSPSYLTSSLPSLILPSLFTPPTLFFTPSLTPFTHSFFPFWFSVSPLHLSSLCI